MANHRIVFSPTGGTLKALDALTEDWDIAVDVDLSDASLDFDQIKMGPEDVVVIAMPSFGGLAPQIALDRLTRIKGNGARCALLAVYGNRAFEDTLVQMADAARSAGFTTITAAAAIAEHSILRQYAAGRPDAQDRTDLREFGRQILQKAADGKTDLPTLPGNRPYKKPGAGMVPKAGGACTSCGLCAQQCPVGAISPDNPQSTDKRACIGCMRCVTQCPAHARTVSKVMTAIAAAAIKKACETRKDCHLFI